MTRSIHSRFNSGTRPSTVFNFVTLTSVGWTQLWSDDPARSFANVLGGTGPAGPDLLVTTNPLAAPSDPDVSNLYAVRSPGYFETRGTNALYARFSAGPDLAVRTSTAVQVPKFPAPGGLIKTNNYRIVTETGTTAPTYLGTTRFQGVVLPRQDERLRASLYGNVDTFMYLVGFNLDAELVTIGGPSPWTSGSYFPGPLVATGTDIVVLEAFSVPEQQSSVGWIADFKELLS